MENIKKWKLKKELIVSLLYIIVNWLLLHFFYNENLIGNFLERGVFQVFQY